MVLENKWLGTCLESTPRHRQCFRLTHVPGLCKKPDILLRLPRCRYVSQFPQSVHVRIGMESTTLLWNNALLSFERTLPMLASPWKPGRSIQHRRVKNHHSHIFDISESVGHTCPAKGQSLPRHQKPGRPKCDTMTLSSNEKRAQRRQDCREALAAHICKEYRASIIERIRR